MVQDDAGLQLLNSAKEGKFHPIFDTWKWMLKSAWMSKMPVFQPYWATPQVVSKAWVLMLKRKPRPLYSAHLLGTFRWYTDLVSQWGKDCPEIASLIGWATLKTSLKNCEGLRDVLCFPWRQLLFPDCWMRPSLWQTQIGRKLQSFKFKQIAGPFRKLPWHWFWETRWKFCGEMVVRNEQAQVGGRRSQSLGFWFECDLSPSWQDNLKIITSYEHNYS